MTTKAETAGVFLFTGLKELSGPWWPLVLLVTLILLGWAFGRAIRELAHAIHNMYRAFGEMTRVFLLLALVFLVGFGAFRFFFPREPSAKDLADEAYQENTYLPQAEEH